MSALFVSAAVFFFFVVVLGTSTKMQRTSSMDSLVDFKTDTPESLAETMEAELAKIKGTTRDIVRNNDQFKILFEQYIEEKGTKIEWSRIKPPTAGSIIKYGEIPEAKEDGVASALSKLAVLKLNGGLGTSMGCVGPKSAIAVRNDATFLDLCVKQIEVWFPPFFPPPFPHSIAFQPADMHACMHAHTCVCVCVCSSQPAIARDCACARMRVYACVCFDVLGFATLHTLTTGLTCVCVCVARNAFSFSTPSTVSTCHLC